MTPLQMELVRTAAEVVASLVISVGLPLLGAWAVRKNLIQARWETMIEAAVGAGYNAGRLAGPIGSAAFLTAAAAGILAYAKGQAADVLKAKGMTDDATVEAGLARLAMITGGLAGPAGAVEPGQLVGGAT